MRIAVIIPAYGHHHITHAAVGDLAREDADGPDSIDCIVVDNQGGYEPTWREQVLRPGRNLGWLDGTNLGWQTALETGYDVYVPMNNDVRLSRGFFTALAKAQRLTGAGLVGPGYDSLCVHQQVEVEVPAEDYRSRRLHWRAPFADGTCLFVPASTVDRVGLLDPRFNPFGWGAEIDYSFRVQDAGMLVVVTALAFLHHHSETTAREMHGGEGYREDAFLAMAAGMREKYGGGASGWGPRSSIDEHTLKTAAIPQRQRVLDTIRLEARARLRSRRAA
jgi:GT2 family glycosyltransferase